MNLVIELSVTLPSGAMIQISEKQRTSITDFVESLLLSQTNKRTCKRTLGARRWSDEEDIAVLDALDGKTKKQIKSLKLPLAQRCGRTPAAVYARFKILTKNSNKKT